MRSSRNIHIRLQAVKSALFNALEGFGQFNRDNT